MVPFGSQIVLYNSCTNLCHCTNLFGQYDFHGFLYRPCTNLCHCTNQNLAAKSICTRFGTIICYFSCKIVIFQPATHHTIRSPHFRQMPPKATNKTKNWGEPDRDHLYDLIQTGQVDIGDLSLENIEAVRQEHFRHRDIRNFCQNFKDFSAAFDLEAEHRGTRRIGGGEGKLRCMVLIIICVRVL